MSLPALTLPRLLSADEVAETLGVSRAQVYLLKDRIGYVLVGAKGIRFEPDALFAYIANQRRCHAPALVSTASLGLHSGKPAGPTIKVGSTASPRAVATMERLRRGSRRVN
jgi:hypothetical protein